MPQMLSTGDDDGVIKVSRSIDAPRSTSYLLLSSCGTLGSLIPSEVILITLILFPISFG